MPRRHRRHAALPNLIIIGGLKCGTTSIHHYLGLHPEIHMSKPKELNFFVEELNWDLGLDWYRGRFDGRYPVRGESSPHYTNLPYFSGVPERIAEHVPDARLIYMVRDPISRILSHWAHAVGAGYETRPMEDALARADQTYVTRSRYWMQLQPYLEHFDRSQIEVITQEELQSDRKGTMRKAFRFAGVDEDFYSEQFEREWEVERQGVRALPVHGEADQAPRLPILRPELRSVPGADALDGREDRPRPRAPRHRSRGCRTRSSSP